MLHFQQLYIKFILSLFLEVGAYPKIMGNDGSSTLEFDLNEMNRTLRCEVSGDPLPEVVWYKDNDVRHN